MRVILDKLAPFVKHGNQGHSHYMSTTLKEGGTCDIPLASQLKVMRYAENDEECNANPQSCSRPEY